MRKWAVKPQSPQPSRQPQKVQQKASGFGNFAEDQKFEDTIYWGIIIAAIVGIVVIAGFIILNQSSSDSQNAFTAIYFGDYNKDVYFGTVDFNFAVENHEGKTTNYIADINFDSETAKTIEFSLEKDQNFEQRVILPFTLDKRTVHKVSVSLRDRNESIHYWTNIKKEYPATFGENIAFLSYEIQPQPAIAGKDFNITYNWKCLKPTDLNYTIAVHFVDSAGKIIFQNDHLPKKQVVDGNYVLYPTSECAPGDTFSESYSVFAKQKGEYGIRIGFYFKSGETAFDFLDVDASNEHLYTIGSIRIS